MKQVHNIRVRVVDRDRQLIEGLLQKFLDDAGIERKDAQITWSDDGEESDPLFIGELWLDRQQQVRRAVSMLASKLPPEAKEDIRAHPDRFIDTATHCFLRLDKAAFLADEVKLGSAGSTVQVRINLAAFPATKERAMPVLQELFG